MSDTPRAVALQIASNAIEDVLRGDDAFFRRVHVANYPFVTTDTFVKLVGEEMTKIVVELQEQKDRRDE